VTDEESAVWNLDKVHMVGELIATTPVDPNYVFVGLTCDTPVGDDYWKEEYGVEKGIIERRVPKSKKISIGLCRE
jgi:hypothetical protein